MPFCAQQGVTLDPNQIIAPAPTVVENIQFITPTALDIMQTPTALLIVQQTQTPTTLQQTPVAAVGSSNPNGGLIAGVVIAGVFIVAIAVFTIIGIAILFQIRKKKIDSKFPRTYNSRRISNGVRCKFAE